MSQQQNNDTQVKSKQRVSDHGEVFTAQREVNAMLDLVKQETERIDSRFLEPACGTGNFLVEILQRKLAVVEERYSKNQLDYERYSIIALSSIYGVDILEDNVKTCQDRLFGIFTDHHLKNYHRNVKAAYLVSAKFILKRNILWGDALDLRTPYEKREPIIFSEWSAVEGSMIKRRDFTFEELARTVEYNKDENNLFSDAGVPVCIPTPIRDFPLTHFLELADYDDTNKL